MKIKEYPEATVNDLNKAVMPVETTNGTKYASYLNNIRDYLSVARTDLSIAEIKNAIPCGRFFGTGLKDSPEKLRSIRNGSFDEIYLGDRYLEYDEETDREYQFVVVGFDYFSDVDDPMFHHVVLMMVSRWPEMLAYYSTNGIYNGSETDENLSSGFAHGVISNIFDLSNCLDLHLDIIKYNGVAANRLNNSTITIDRKIICPTQQMITGNFSPNFGLASNNANYVVQLPYFRYCGPFIDGGGFMLADSGYRDTTGLYSLGIDTSSQCRNIGSVVNELSIINSPYIFPIIAYRGIN